MVKGKDMRIGGMPPWAHTVGSVAVATVLALGWAESRFVTRAELSMKLNEAAARDSGLAAKIGDLADLIREHANQPSHAGTIGELREISDRLTRIETSLGLSYRTRSRAMNNGAEK